MKRHTKTKHGDPIGRCYWFDIIFIDYDQQGGLVRYAQKRLFEATTGLSMFGRDTVSEMCAPIANAPSKEESSHILKRISRIASRLSENPAIKRGKCNIKSDRLTENTLTTSFHCTISWSSVIFGIPAYHCCTPNPVLRSDIICMSCLSLSLPVLVFISGFRSALSATIQSRHVFLPWSFLFHRPRLSCYRASCIRLLTRNQYCP